MMKELLKSLKDIVELLQEYWYKPLGLLTTEIVGIALVTIIITNISSIPILNSILYAFIILLLYIAWLYTRRCPKTKKGKVGFAICINCSNEEEREKIREDFIDTLQNLIKRGDIGKTFHVITIPEHISEKINDNEKAELLRQKCKAHFFLYGRVRLRDLNNKKFHVIDLDGIVSHGPIPKEISQQISNEFAELLPRQIQIATENDLLTFNFTTELAEYIAKYIIGVASTVSGDLNYAENLFNDITDRINRDQTNFPVIVKIKQRIPLRLAEINETRASMAHRLWTKNHDSASIEKIGEALSKINNPYLDRYRVRILKSIHLFLSSRDVDSAITTLSKCKLEKDNTWRFNLAFLYAYKGELHKAIRQYKFLADPRNPEIKADILSQIEDFFYWLLQEEPERYQLYCLGFINWKIKGDTLQAINDFEKFLASGDQGKFSKERGLITQWLQELKQSNSQ